MRKKTIVAVNNVYSLMQYLLLRTDEVGSTLFVFDSMPDAIQRRFAPLRPLTTGTKWNKAFYIPLRLHLAALVARQTPVYISYPAYCCNLLLDLFPNAFYIEEGAGDYCDREVGLAPPPPDRRWDRRLRFGKKRLRRDIYAAVGKIYLTGILPIQQHMQAKTQLVDLQASWRHKSQQERELINSLLLPEGFDCAAFEGRDILLVTQPYYIDCGARPVSIDQQIEAYRRLVAPYEQQRLIIKVHPRDKADYRRHFPDALVFDYPSPLELLVLNGMTIRTALTFDSTAIHQTGAGVEKIIAHMSTFAPLPSTTRVGILYIGIGRYDFFWKDFYLSAERYFFQHPGYSRHYYVFSDSPALYGEADNPRIHRLHQPNLGWPDNTMKRFHMFLRIGARLQEETDYLFFFNANMEFKQPVGSEILPTKADKEGLVAGIHPGYYRLRKWKWTYERRPASACYVPFYQGRHYFQGTLWGGRTEAVVRLCEACRQMIDSDVAKGLIPVWHDESAMNRYFIDHPPKALDCSYNYAEGHVLPGCDVKILSRDKERYFTFRQLGRSSYKESAQMPRAWRAYEQTMAFLFESRAGCWLLNKLKI